MPFLLGYIHRNNMKIFVIYDGSVLVDNVNAWFSAQYDDGWCQLIE